MVNNEAGAFLNITPDVLKKLDSFDEKLEMIEKHAHTAADALKNGFGSVVMNTSKLESVITSLAKKIDAIKGNPFEGAGKGAEETTRKTTSLNESLSRAADLLNRIGNNKIGEGSFANFNISGLKQGYSDLKKYVENMDLSKPQQKAAVEAMRYMKMELDEQRKTDEQRAQSKEKETERRIAADRRAYKASADLAKAQNYKQNTTAQGALDFSKTANTLQRQITAIEYLKKARLSLNTTDANYKSTLEQINQAIAKHNQALTEAGVKSQQLATRHRNLMDTAGQLSRQLALLFSVSQIEGYISKLAKVRGEFELQQRSLQAILQNKSQADQIFNKTVQLAVKSPFQIKELVTFTKQLAAYRIESDKLYDTTKRLADVSAGLGVDMGRLILAYGQVKAAAYLRGTEVRQFTEAGINMYGELQKLFKTRDQADYTTAQIVDMISKRKVTFEDVEQVFENLTSKEGIFYNMQEIQSETLQGKISNLKDSIDVMLNSIGKANEDTLKGAIDAAKVLIENWESVVSIGNALVGVFALLYMHSLRTGVAMKAVFSTNMAANATKTLKTTELLANGFKSLSLAVRTFSANLKAAFVTNLPALGIIAVITAVSDAFTRLQNKSEAILDIFKEMGDKKKGLYQISDAYKQIISASSNAKDAEISDTKEVIDKKREQINKLVELYNKNGLKIDIQLKDIPQSEIDEYFSKLYNGYANFIRLQESLKIALAENNGRIEGWFGVFGENIETDSKQLTNAYNNVIENTRDLGNAISLLINYYDNLSKSQKKQYEQQYKGLIDASTRNDGESEIAYLERQSKAISDFSKSIGTTLDKSVIKAREYSKQFRIALTGAKGTGGYKEYLREFDNELDDILERVKSRYSEKEWDINGKVYLESILDTELASQGWEQWKIDHAKERWNIKPKIDKEEAKQEALTLRDQLQAEFDRNKITINVDYATSKQGLIDYWMDGQEQMQKTADVLKKQLEYVRAHPDQYYLGGELQKMGFNLSGIKTKRGKQADENTYIDSKRVEAEIQKRLEALAKSGVTPKAGGSKAERDIWAERISVLKEMQSRYEKLNQLMGENRAIEETRSAFKGALDFTQMGEVIKAEDIIPTKQGMIDALEKLLKQIPNDVKNAAKRTGLEKEIAELKIGIQQDYLKEQLEKTKKNIEDMFNQLDLHKKLKDAGLSEAEVQQLFPGLAKTLDDVQRSIDIEFQTKYADTYKDPNTQQYKDYQDAIKEIDQQRIKEQQDTAERLIKSYKAQLSEQLQLDEQYYKDLEEIRDKFQNTPDLQKRLEENATKMYNQKSANNAWKEFTSLDSYLNLFDNIEYYSTAALQSMKDKLVKMREELKDLSPTELKQIMEQEKKLDKQLNQRDPWNKLIKSLKEYTKLRKENAKNEKDEAKARDLQAKYEKQLRTQSKIVAEKKAAYESATENIDAALEEYEVEKNNYDLLVDKKKEQDKIIAGYDAANRALSQQAQKLQGIIQSLGKIDLGGGMVESISGITNSVSDFAHMLEDSFGVAIGEDLYEILDGVGALFGSLESFDITKPISSSLNVLTGLGKTIGSIFGIGNKNKKKEREIQRQIKNIESLGRAYDELKEKMEAAWNADDLRTQTKDTIANLDQQIESYENMINSEEAKKDSDRDRIDEWNDAINELKKTRQEILDQQKLELGGIGGESEYKDAASSFVQAWMDAFNETEDGLKALNENFDSFIENLIVKQATMRLAQGRLKELFEKIDESVTEGSVGGINLTKEELANIQALGESALKGLNEDLLALMETLGYKGTSVGQKSELSALTQSIQGVSETTAEALEALLNSIRFFVNQQTTDIAAIRMLLEARYSLESQSGESNPMIVELRAQTRYLEILSDRIDRVFAPSPNSKGPALRVVMQ